MDVVSLGFRTDLMLRRLAGATITDHGSYLVVRTDSNPGFWWGNFLLLAEPPRHGDAKRWRSSFDTEFPSAAHLAIGIDGTAGDAGDEAELAELGVVVDRPTVLTATRLQPPERPNPEAVYRLLDGDDDWAQALALQTRCDDIADSADQQLFRERRVAEQRRLCELGHGVWFGAFLHGRLRAGLGLFTDGADRSGLARYQAVETDPDFRQQGLASGLVHAAGLHGQRELGARTLVIVADPAYVAIRIYRALGFTGQETQVLLERPPTPA